MAGSYTLGIVKPDAVQNGRMGLILAHLEQRYALLPVTAAG
ncbi:MAG: hypothetical protein AAB075_00005, partial [Gemmatimonadota bacterium]